MIEVDVDHRQGDFRLEAAFRSEARLTALFGRSGSGKSTLVSLIAGLKRPTRGRIAVDGTVLVDTAKDIFVPSRRRRVGLVFQDALLFPHLSVRHNLAFGRWFAPRAERRIAMDDVVATLGIGHLLDRRPLMLSGGERQRVAIGRALIASPRILLLDEPLASLDRARKLEILPLIERLRDHFGVPIVHVSHAVEEVARLAGEVVLLEAGRVAAVGPPEDVLGRATGGPDADADRFALASVLTARVAGYDEAYALTRLDHPAGPLYLAGRLGRRAAEDGTVRVLIRATDVTLAAEAPARTTVRTVLAGRIAAIRPSGEALAIVDVALDGGGRLTAVVTRMGLDALGRAVGEPVHALVKAVAVDERPVG
jgi:molybdate transport system ATP-binding protein